VNTLEEDDIRNMFSQYGTIKAFKFFNNDRKMALIELSSTEEATLALMGLHNYQVGDSLHLRVSFSKSTING
jgi:RNA recognition motif-containing protein